MMLMMLMMPMMPMMMSSGLRIVQRMSFSLCMPLVAAELACLDSEESLFSLRYPAHSSEEGKVDEKCDVE